LVNAAADENCRRCHASLLAEDAVNADQGAEQPGTRGLGRRVIWICGTTLLLLFAAYMSLLLTAEELGFEQRQAVKQAIAVLQQKGFAKEAFVLGNLVEYRSTDNWWNKSVGHHSAYAATNFPFEVMTLYPEFFNTAVDDTERAAILLHESIHLYGAGEEAALEGVWRDKQRLGWTGDKYGQTKVWNNTRELTATSLPKLFQCGTDGHSDCIQ
jgi:hypothetical protein